MRKNICLLFLLPFLCIGCDKEMQEDESIEGAAVPLNILIGNYEDFDDISSPKTRSAETVQTFVQPLDSTKDTGINVVTTIELIPTERLIQTRANMNNNSRFRMVIFNSAGNQVADNQYTVNGNTATLVSGAVPMLVSGTYKFVSYTYNQSTLPSLGNIANVNNQDDFATYCITKNVSESNNTITVAFKRQMSQFELAVSASGFSNNSATYNSALVTNLNTDGTWNINNGSSDDTGLIASGTGNIVCYNNNQYKVLPVSRSLSISFTNLNIGGTNYGEKSVLAPVNFVRKGNYRITIQFTSSDYIIIGGVKWAKGNLHNGQITASQEMAGDGTMNSGYYYNWNSNNPFDRTSKYSSWSDLREPCPAGWHTPSLNEFNSLISAVKCLGTYKGVPGMYFGTSTPPSNQNRDHYVFLPLKGHVLPGGGIRDKRSLYWTKDLDPNEMVRVHARGVGIWDTEFRGVTSDPTNTGGFIRCVKSM